MVVQFGPKLPQKVALSKDAILDALTAERDFVRKGIQYKVASIEVDANAYRIAVKGVQGRSATVDDSMEDASVIWSNEDGSAQSRARVCFVEPEDGVFVLHKLEGLPPTVGTVIRVFQHEFLTPVIDAYLRKETRNAMRELSRRDCRAPVALLSPLAAPFAVLRKQQVAAVNAALFSLSLINGPPGTGKTFAVGAMIANFLGRFPGSRVLIVGPTHTAVDGALASLDDWLARVGARHVDGMMRRVGSRFNVSVYACRQHLLEPAVYTAAMKMEQLEQEKPPKKNFAEFATWKQRVSDARKSIKNGLSDVQGQPRVVATTAATVLRNFSEYSAQPWDLVVCDEASQIPGPSAMMLGSVAKQTVFAGDPKQLMPIVQNSDARSNYVLSKTAFQIAKKAANSVFLDEQSRMCRPISDLVSELFYEKRLNVCKKALSDKTWKKERSAFFVDGKEVPHIAIKGVSTDVKWSQKYNGFIRFDSADFVRKMVGELKGAYADERDILILTPFRAQRNLITSLLNIDRVFNVDVSTVHRAQGSERKIVIFDPVDASGKFLVEAAGPSLVNVAFSRAQVHLIVPLGPRDYHSQVIRQLSQFANRQTGGRSRYDLPPILR